jgi:hypothetical protein
VRASATSFLLSKHTGVDDTAPAFSGSHGKWVFPLLLWSFPPSTTFTSFSAPDYWAVLLLLPATVCVYSSHGRWVFPPLLWSFPPSATLTSFPVPGCQMHAPTPAGAFPARPSLFIYSSRKDSLPQSSVLSVLHPLSHMSLVLIIQFLLFPQVGVGLSRRLCCSGPGLSVGVPWYC